MLTLFISTATLAASSGRCCPGKFTAKGRGSPLPPEPNAPLRAFEFDFFADGSRLAQRTGPGTAAGVDMGTIYLSGVGHFFWSNATDCRSFGAETEAEFYCVGGNATWSVDGGARSLPGGTVLTRWSSASSPWHVLFTANASGSECLPVMEMGFGVSALSNTDDSVFYFDHQVGPMPPGSDSAFQLPAQCTKLLTQRQKHKYFQQLKTYAALKTDDAPGLQLEFPLTNGFWRNDSANVALAATWNRYYDATPLSWDVSSPTNSFSDAPPISLEWSVGRDGPPQKDGHGCLFNDRYLVIAGGEWCHAVTLANTTQPDPPCVAGTRTAMYDTKTDAWSELPPPPYTMFRTTGACGGASSSGGEALYLVSGMSPNISAVPRGLLDSARLTNEGTAAAPIWRWTLLPRLPEGGRRWLGAAGVVGDFLVIAAGANACGFEESADDTSRSRVGSGHDPCFVPCVDAARCPPPLPSYKLALSELETAGGTASKWSAVSKLPGGGGRDVPNAAAVPSGVNGGLYVFGGWRANSAGQAAWKQLYGLDLPVPIAKGTNGARLLRDAYKYNATQDKWERLPDAPMHVAQGGTAVLKGRYIVQVGSAHGYNSFRVGSTNPKVTRSPLATAPRGTTVYADVPEFRLQAGGIAPYYGDIVLVYDTEEKKYSRVGVAPYGLITSHCVSNGTHLICALGEPRHGWNANCETVVQIAKLIWNYDDL